MSHVAGESAPASGHGEVRARIDAGEPGCAQAVVAGQLVSYRRYSMSGFSYDHPMPKGVSHADLMEAVILEVAQGRGRATAETFSRNFLAMMIATRRVLDRGYTTEHEEADLLEALRQRQPELFGR